MLKSLFENNIDARSSIQKTHFRTNINIRKFVDTIKPYKPNFTNPPKGFIPSSLYEYNRELENKRLLEVKWQIQRISGNRKVNRSFNKRNDGATQITYISNLVRLENPTGRYFIEVEYDINIYFVGHVYRYDLNKVSDSALICEIAIENHSKYEFVLDTYDYGANYNPLAVEKTFIQHMMGLFEALFDTFVVKFPNFYPELVTEPKYDKKSLQKFNIMLKRYKALMQGRRGMRINMNKLVDKPKW